MEPQILRGISHYQERFMSEQNAALGERILTEKLTVPNWLKRFGDNYENFPITYDLMKLAWGARDSYLNHLGSSV